MSNDTCQEVKKFCEEEKLIFEAPKIDSNKNNITVTNTTTTILSDLHEMKEEDEGDKFVSNKKEGDDNQTQLNVRAFTEDLRIMVVELSMIGVSVLIENSQWPRVFLM